MITRRLRADTTWTNANLFFLEAVYSTFLCLSFTCGSSFTAADSIRCDIFDPNCRQRIQHHQEQFSQNLGVRDVNRQCKYQDIWLIPGRADASCTRAGAKKLVDIDHRQVSIQPPIVKFPGCFVVEIKNIRIYDSVEILGSSIFAKAEYQWLNVKEFANLKCQNASSNGCGGFGNNCYHCDICEILSEIDKSANALADSSAFSGQFQGLSCPRRPGYYTFRKEFCFNDWSSFDTNGDCRIDFLENGGGDIKSAFSSLQQIGYGTIVAKVRFAHNATQSVERKKALKEAQIERAVARELADRRHSWDINDAQFERFRQWYADYRKNVWHREEYLPWLLYENELSCLRLTFDICERMPHKRPYGSRQSYTCD